MFKSVCEAILGWIIAIIIRLPLFILGLVLVPIGLLFKVEDSAKAKRFTEHNTDRYWWHVGLPKWLWLWSNDRDGARGDKRGWWDANTTVGENADSFAAMFWWLAIRNPVNNMRFHPWFAADLFEADVELLAGQYHVDDDDDGSGLGWQFCRFDNGDVKLYSFYYLSQPMPEWLVKIIPSLKEHVFQIRIGHKIKPRYNDDFPTGKRDEYDLDTQERAWKGFTFRVGFLDYKN